MRAVQTGEIIESQGKVGFVAVLFAKGQRSLKQCLGFGIAALSHIDFRKVAEHRPHRGRAAGQAGQQSAVILIDRDGAQHTFPGIGIPALLALDLREIIQDRGSFDAVPAVQFLHYLQGPVEDWLSLGEQAPIRVKLAERIQNNSNLLRILLTLLFSSRARA